MTDPDKRLKKRVAVIGAGACGLLTSVALNEEGIEPVCFEASDSYGGLWNYTDEVTMGRASLMPTTILNHSKELGALSNFPPDKEYNIYMHHREAFRYFTDCYNHFGCEKYIRFNTEVIKVEKSEDYDETGRFKVTVKDAISKEVTVDVFDGVVVATGHFNFPKMETFPGLEEFEGQVIHTHSLKAKDEFRDKNVLVIGTGCSGLDAATYLSDVAKKVYLSARSGMFVYNRLGPNGYPFDHLILRRCFTFFLDTLPISLASWYLETFYIDTKFDHSLYHVRPKAHALSKDPVLSDTIAYNLMSGLVTQKGAVKNFSKNGVLFEREETVTELDAVIMATGYSYKFPFLEDGLLEVEDGRINLYKCVYPAHLSHSTLAFAGFVNPTGPGVPIAEIQARWIAHVFAGKGKLPSKEVMLREAVERHRQNLRRYVPSEYMSVRIDLVCYMDDISAEIGCKPKLLKYFFTDFLLFLRLVFGPSLPYQYRLEGPHKWEGAKEAIMTCDERMRFPLVRGKGRKKGVWQHILEYIGNLIPRNLFR